MGARLTENAAIGLRTDAILMRVGRPADLAGGGVAVLRELGQARSKARIDVALQDFGSRRLGELAEGVGVDHLDRGPFTVQGERLFLDRLAGAGIG